MNTSLRIAMCVGGGIAGFYATQNIPRMLSPAAPPVVITEASKIKPFKGDPKTLLSEMLDATPEEISALSRRVERDPGDIEGRARLLAATSFSFRDGERSRWHAEQAVWFAANLPGSQVLKEVRIHSDPISDAHTFDLISSLFQKALDREPNSVPVLMNYAQFIKVGAVQDSIELQKRAIAIRPQDASLYYELGVSYQLADCGIFIRSAENAPNALANLVKARDLGYAMNGSYITESAFDAGEFEIATREAKACLKDPEDGDAVHCGHRILGQIALQKGDLEAAKSHLLKSAKVDGSPVLGSFGPSMELAKLLLQKGERATVAEYLERCGEFWEDERQVRWLKQVRDGGTPDWD
ncbi:hypothetical protein EON79_11140 [bacterium]|nr:MAG: hypothetical protein EON79_11140 [bacterium]